MENEGVGEQECGEGGRGAGGRNHCNHGYMVNTMINFAMAKVRLDGWIDRWMDGWMDGWKDGWS